MRARADSVGIVPSAEKSYEAVWDGVKGNTPITAVADAAAATTAAAVAAAMVAAAAAVAGTLAPAPVSSSAPEGGGRRPSMNSWHEADIKPPLPADVSVGDNDVCRAWCRRLRCKAAAAGRWSWVAGGNRSG